MREIRMIPRRLVALAAAALLSLACPTARAAEYQMVASGPVRLLDPFSRTFDGTTTATNTLPPLLDVARLAGGSFRATFRFSTEYTVHPGEFYDLSPSSGITFDLLDSSGGVVHHGGNPSAPFAILSNNFGGAPFVTDQAAFYATVNNVTGSTVPAPLYGSGVVFTTAGLNFSANVSEGHDVLSDDVNVPTDVSTYLAFPGRILDMVIQFGDGDYLNAVGPYQRAFVVVQYDITALTVTPVPEPSLASLLMSAVAVQALRDRRLDQQRRHGPRYRGRQARP